MENVPLYEQVEKNQSRAQVLRLIDERVLDEIIELLDETLESQIPVGQEWERNPRSLFMPLETMMRVEKAMNALATILSREDLHLSERLFDKGLVEYCLILVQQPKFSSVALNILGNMAFQVKDIAQALLTQKMHLLVIQTMRNAGIFGDARVVGDVVNSTPGNMMFNQTNQSSIKFNPEYGWFILQQLAQIGDQSNYAVQKQQLCSFVIEALHRGSTQTMMLQLLYSLARNHKTMIVQQGTDALNNLIESCAIQSQFCYHLLHVCLRLSPAPLNYLKLAPLMLNKRNVEVGLYIMLQLKLHSQLSWGIPTDEVWWERMVALAVTTTLMHDLLRVAAVLTPLKDLLWRLLHQALLRCKNSTDNKKLLTQVLLIIHQTIGKCGNPSEISQLLFMMDKHRIVDRLSLVSALDQKLTHKVNLLLDEIGNLSRML